MRSQPIKPKSGSATLQNVSTTRIEDLQKLAEIGRLSASLIHEISNPITSALINLELYKDHSSAGAKKALKSIKALNRYVNAARQQIRKESRIIDFKLTNQVTQLKQIVIPLAMQSGIKLKISPVPDIKLHGDPVKFQQILSNLIVNAVEAYEIDNFPALEKYVIVEFSLKAKVLRIKVTDWGKGISPEELKHIFQAYYSTKSKSGHGLGIGLAIVYDYVVNNFSGHVDAKSSTRLGTIFTVKIPIRT